LPLIRQTDRRTGRTANIKDNPLETGFNREKKKYTSAILASPRQEKSINYLRIYVRFFVAVCVNLCTYGQIKQMEKFISKHSAKLKTTALILMLLIPFLLYAAAIHGSAFQVTFFLALMSLNMLFVMVKS